MLPPGAALAPAGEDLADDVEPPAPDELHGGLLPLVRIAVADVHRVGEPSHRRHPSPVSSRHRGGARGAASRGKRLASTHSGRGPRSFPSPRTAPRAVSSCSNTGSNTSRSYTTALRTRQRRTGLSTRHSVDCRDGGSLVARGHPDGPALVHSTRPAAPHAPERATVPGVIPARPLVATAAGLALAGLLAGCSQEAPAAPAPAAAATSTATTLDAWGNTPRARRRARRRGARGNPTPTPTATRDLPRPELSDVGRTFTEDGASTFANYYVRVLNYSRNSGDVELLKSISDAGCSGVTTTSRTCRECLLTATRTSAWRHSL